MMFLYIKYSIMVLTHFSVAWRVVLSNYNSSCDGYQTGCLICIAEANVMYIPRDPPLLLHLPTSWQPAHSWSCPHILLQRWGCRDSNSSKFKSYVFIHCLTTFKLYLPCLQSLTSQRRTPSNLGWIWSIATYHRGLRLDHYCDLWTIHFWCNVGSNDQLIPCLRVLQCQIDWDKSKTQDPVITNPTL